MTDRFDIAVRSFSIVVAVGVMVAYYFALMELPALFESMGTTGEDTTLYTLLAASILLFPFAMAFSGCMLRAIHPEQPRSA